MLQPDASSPRVLSPGRTRGEDALPTTPKRPAADSPAATSSASQSPVFAKTPGSQGSPVGTSQPSPPVTPSGLGGDSFADVDMGNVIYGTDLRGAQVLSDFCSFIKGFREPGQSESERPHYLRELDRRWEEQRRRDKGIKFPISGSHIFRFSQRLYDNMVNFPTDVLPIFDRELRNISIRELREKPEKVGPCQVKVCDLEEKDYKTMRNIDPKDIEHLILLRGIVTHCSDLIPDISLSDCQILKLQEMPDVVPEGETPQNIVVCCHDDLVDHVSPGDRVEVIGIYRASAVRPMLNRNMLNSVYRASIDAIAITAEQKGL